MRFEPIGVECITCHQDEYASTTTPNHEAAGYSTDCSECHSIDAFEWSAFGINHDFFPLTLGHDIADCAKCHTDDDFSMTSPECISCHQGDFDNASNPNHIQADFPTDCASCHTTDPDWQPAEFRDHDVQYFPIYGGEHGGEWNLCSECHLDPDNFGEFSCIDCHENLSLCFIRMDLINGVTLHCSNLLSFNIFKQCKCNKKKMKIEGKNKNVSKVDLNWMKMR